MPSVFISYRRTDAAAHAGRLFDRLAEAFGREQVFMDIERIGPGADFVNTINSTIGACDCVVVLIGSRWLSAAAEDGTRRLDDPADFVRLEVAAALARETLVIPVLVDGAGMPGAEDLPAGLEALARRNALELSHGRFHQDVDRLVSAVRGAATGDRTGAAGNVGRGRRRLLVAAAVGIAALAGAGAFLSGALNSDPSTALAGTWEMQVSYGWLNKPLTERLELERHGERLVGTMSFLEVPRAIHDLTVADGQLSFIVRWTQILGSETSEIENRYVGIVTDAGIDFVMQDSRGYRPLRFVATRVSPAG